MVGVAEAQQIILQQEKDFGIEKLPLELTVGRVLAEDLFADRDLPPCNRATMDGIAVKYDAFAKGQRSFRIIGTIAAGDTPADISADDECLEIMTGAGLPASADTIIRYEDIHIQNGYAQVTADNIRKGQNLHIKGKDKKQGDLVASANQFVDAALISMAASVGKDTLLVRNLPTVVIISTGDELVGLTDQPNPFQVRSSNSHTINAALQQYGLQCDLLHIPDEITATREKINNCLDQYDVLILTGGVSMGKFDYVPQVLDELSVTKLFHKVQQRPGKPFWFGRDTAGKLVFAFPGNPVSTFLCLHRYFIPWLITSLKCNAGMKPKYAVLDADISFAPALQYFVQVNIRVSSNGQLLATPIEGNGSGDFANLLDSNAFMELPMEKSNFMKGEVYSVWPFKPII